MPIEFEAIYEDGVLKPTTPVTLDEHQRVKVTVQNGDSIARRSYGIIGWTGDPKVVEEIALAPEFGESESP